MNKPGFWVNHFIKLFFGTISNTGTNVETPQDWTQNLGIFKHLPIKNVQIYERWSTWFLYFKIKIVLWIWIQNLWFGSGTREKSSGYTTHEITIFNIIYFFFWPKNGVSAIKVSLWYFKILSRFYLFNLCCLVLHHGGQLPMDWWVSSRPLIPLCCFLMVLLPSRLGSRSVRKLANVGFSQIVMVHFQNFV